MIKPMDIEKILTEGIVFKGSKLNGKKKEEYRRRRANRHKNG